MDRSSKARASRSAVQGQKVRQVVNVKFVGYPSSKPPARRRRPANPQPPKKKPDESTPPPPNVPIQIRYAPPVSQPQQERDPRIDQLLNEMRYLRTAVPPPNAIGSSSQIRAQVREMETQTEPPVINIIKKEAFGEQTEPSLADLSAIGSMMLPSSFAEASAGGAEESQPSRSGDASSLAIEPVSEREIRGLYRDTNPDRVAGSNLKMWNRSQWNRIVKEDIQAIAQRLGGSLTQQRNGKTKETTKEDLISYILRTRGSWTD